MEAKLRGTPLTWDVVERLFLAKYEGVDNRLLYEQELDTLQLGRGRCGDINKLDAEIDRLRMIVYPESEVDEMADRLVASKYGAAEISRGDRDMFSDILKMGGACAPDAESVEDAGGSSHLRPDDAAAPAAESQSDVQAGRIVVQQHGHHRRRVGEQRSVQRAGAGDRRGEQQARGRRACGGSSRSEHGHSSPPGRNRSVANKPRQPGGRHTLSDEEFNHRRLNRLCWSCGAPDHRADGCPPLVRLTRPPSRGRETPRPGCRRGEAVQARPSSSSYTSPSPNPYRSSPQTMRRRPRREDKRRREGEQRISITAAWVSAPKGGGGGRLDSKTSRTEGRGGRIERRQ